MDIKVKPGKDSDPKFLLINSWTVKCKNFVLPHLYSFLKTNKTLDLIDNYYKSNKKVLIHCMAGAQRSAAVAACYLVAKHNCKPEDAIAYIKSKRHIAFLGHVNFKETINMFA